MSQNTNKPPAAASLRFDQGSLLLSGVGEREGRSFLAPQMWVWDDRVPAWRCHAMYYAAVSQALRGTLGQRLADEIAAPPSLAWREVKLPALRPEQQDAIAAWRAADRRGQIIMPTGTGKTEVALAAMAETGIATLIVAPVRDLMYQWHRRILKAFGYDAGIVGDNIFNVRPVTVTTYDSACIHMPRLGDRFGLIIFDEEHHLPGQFRRDAALMSMAPMRMGLTATPERSDDRHKDLDYLIGPVVYSMPLRQAKGSTLADFDVVRIPVKLSDEEQAIYDQCSLAVRQFIHQRQQDHKGYDWQDLCKESGRDPEARRAQKAYYAKRAIEDRAEEKLRVLEDIFRLHVGQRVIVFTGSNMMAMEISRRFLVPTILSHTRKKERLAVLEGFAAELFPVLVANQVLDEGVDVPEAKVAVVVGGLSSTRQAKQRLGRILRRSGNMRAILYEVVCEDTKEAERSRTRRRSDAYERTIHRRV